MAGSPRSLSRKCPPSTQLSIHSLSVILSNKNGVPWKKWLVKFWTETNKLSPLVCTFWPFMLLPISSQGTQGQDLIKVIMGPTNWSTVTHIIHYEIQKILGANYEDWVVSCFVLPVTLFVYTSSLQPINVKYYTFVEEKICSHI